MKVNLGIETEMYPSPPNTLFSSLSLFYIRHDEQMKMGKFISQKIKIEKEDLALVTVKNTAFIELLMIKCSSSF